MKNKAHEKLRGKCDPTLISLYLDGELDSDKEVEIKDHLKGCSSCQRALADYRAASSLLKAGADRALARANLVDLEEKVLERTRSGRRGWWWRLKDLSPPKKILIPAAAMAGALLLFLAYPRPPSPVSGPSAIINSFTGEISSVIFIETPESRQTIIWFREAVMNGGESDETQDTYDRSTLNQPYRGPGSLSPGRA